MTRRDSSSTEEPHPPLPVVLDGAQLTVDQLTALAREPIVIEPDPAALDHTRRSWETAVRIAERQPIYGRTTGVGATGTPPSPAASTRTFDFSAATPPARAPRCRITSSEPP